MNRLETRISEGLTFDDIVLVPQYSECLPAEVDVVTRLTRGIALNIPIVSAAMDTVTEAPLAIALAQEGGIGFIHKNLPIDVQAAEVDKVKRSEAGMIVDPVTVSPDAPVSDALALMAKFRISGVPVTDGGKLVGILTNRDLRFETRTTLRVAELMTRDPLITVRVGATLEEAKELLHKHKVEKVLVVDEANNLRGLITVKDIQKRIKYPNACKDSAGRLRVGGAVGIAADTLDRVRALVDAKVDVIAIDTAHGHTRAVIEMVGRVRNAFPDLELVAGNVGTKEGAKDLVSAGVSAVKVGMGPGSICTTRIVSGAGMPQVTAIAEAVEACGHAGVPVIADGGIKFALRGRGRESGRGHSAAGSKLQDLSRNGVARGHEGRVEGPVLPGRRRAPEAGAGRRRGHRALPRPALHHRAAARRRGPGRHGLLRRALHSRASDQDPVHQALRGRTEGKPRARCRDHQGITQLPGGVI
jgi:IMP dehydrogenase